ncbi:MAG: DUF6145 family protein [Lachnospiraceae bacterium]|nr:DUF6145 family protein [Lachnospiraceae bacterium]
MTEERMVLCGANAYEQKYYYNREKFDSLPKELQDELHVICVLYTEEVGGIITFEFEEDGSVYINTMADENDFDYDEIHAGLLLTQIKSTRRDMLQFLSLYYRKVILGEEMEDME